MVSEAPSPLYPVLAGILADAAPERTLRTVLPGLLSGGEPRRILALGKAGRAMARGAAILWPGVPGLLYEVEGPGPAPPGWVVLSGSHPLPAPENLESTRLLCAWLGTTEGPLLALISGGTSSLLVDPAPPWTLPQKVQVCADLLASGAPIAEINAIRMRLSRVKGGGLRRRIPSGPVFTGIWCDVAPRDSRLAGSAPTLSVPSPLSAETVVARRGLNIPWPLPPDRILRRAPSGDRHAVLFSGETLAALAVRVFEGLGYRARPMRLPEGTDAGSLAAKFRELAQGAPGGKSIWIVSGEVSTLAGGGRGGRCSHLAALVALELAGLRGWTFAALATDGVDGAGDGGALVSADAMPSTAEICDAVGGGDTASLWAAHGTGLPRKPSGNNLRDLYVLAVDR